jgi:ABC-type bacteriocin/lantibiotic exporter with double-glycine peptidase domain
MSFASKVITGGVFAKAILMGTLVTIIAATSFYQSVILVLVSATATGIFGILIVIIQTHSERAIHARIDALDSKADTAVEKIDSLDSKANTAVEATQEIKDQTQVIADKVSEKT